MRLSLQRLTSSLQRQEYLSFRVANSIFGINTNELIAVSKGVLDPTSPLTTFCYRRKKIALVSAEYIYETGVRVQKPRDVFVIRYGQRLIAVAVDEILDGLLFVDSGDLRDVQLCYDPLNRKPWATVESKGDTDILLLRTAGVIVQ